MSYPIAQNRNSDWLPEKQGLVLAFIEDEIAAGRPFPTSAEISAHMGWKTSGSAYDCLMRLVWRGRLRRVENAKFEVINGFVRQVTTRSLEVAS